MMDSKTCGTYKKIRLVALCAGAALLAGCATVPVVRTQTVVGANLVGAHTFGYVRRLGTDTGPYHSITSQRLEQDVTQQMEARGYGLVSKGQKPDLLVDFRITSHGEVEGGYGPMFGYDYWGGWGPGWGWGWGGPYGPGWGWGWGGGYYNDIRTIPRATLTVTVINARNRMAVWSGSTAVRVTRHMWKYPSRAVNMAVARIFKHYPVRPVR